MAKITVVDFNKLVGRGETPCVHCKQTIERYDNRVNTLRDGSVHIDCYAPAVAAGTLGFRDYDWGGVHLVNHADDLGSIFETYQFLLLQAVQILIHYRLSYDVGGVEAENSLDNLRDLQAPVRRLQTALDELLADIADSIEDTKVTITRKPTTPEVKVPVPSISTRKPPKKAAAVKVVPTQKKRLTPAKPKRAPAKTVASKKPAKAA
jgi:hypothetical protein